MPLWRANRQSISIGGFRGRYWDIGDADAPIVVLLPSQLARGQAYLRTANAIAHRGMRVMVAEMPGTGGGSCLDSPWTFDDYAHWAGALLERFSLKDVTLIGHSNSGATALLMTADDRHRRISRLILVDSTGARPLGSIGGVIAHHVPEFPFEYWFNWRAGPDVFYNMLVHWRNFWQQVRSAVTHVIMDRAARVMVPALIAWGAYDRTVPVDCATIFARAIPDSRTHWSEDGRHDWIIEHPEEFSATVARFVGILRAPPAPLR